MCQSQSSTSHNVITKLVEKFRVNVNLQECSVRLLLRFDLWVTLEKKNLQRKPNRLDVGDDTSYNVTRFLRSKRIFVTSGRVLR